MWFSLLNSVTQTLGCLASESELLEANVPKELENAIAMCREDRVLLSCGERSVDIYSFLLEPRKGRCVHLNCLRVLDEVEEESSTTEEGIVQDLS